MKRRSLAEAPPEGVSHDVGITKRVLLRAGDVPHLTQLAQARLAPGERTTPHAHADMHEIFLVEQGSGVLHLNGTAHPLGPGVCVVVEPGETHVLESTGPDELVLSYFGIAAAPR